MTASRPACTVRPSGSEMGPRLLASGRSGPRMSTNWTFPLRPWAIICCTPPGSHLAQSSGGAGASEVTSISSFPVRPGTWVQARETSLRPGALMRPCSTPSR